MIFLIKNIDLENGIEKNNPQTALNCFLRSNKKKFRIDYDIYKKLLFSNQPKGYLISI